MSTTTVPTQNDRSDVFAGRTIAQWLCLLGGITLILVGLLGFIAESSFSTSDELERGSFLGFDVNGWHNLVHIATGAFLLSGAAKRKTAKTVALTFGVTYLLVTLIGIIDGDDLLGLAPINSADNVLHAVLALAAIAAALASRGDDHGHSRI